MNETKTNSCDKKMIEDSSEVKLLLRKGSPLRITELDRPEPSFVGESQFSKVPTSKNILKKKKDESSDETFLKGRKKKGFEAAGVFILVYLLISLYSGQQSVSSFLSETQETLEAATPDEAAVQKTVFNEFNSTSSLLTDRDFFYHSDQENKTDSSSSKVWTLERIRVINPNTNNDEVVPTPEFEEALIETWCPQPFLSVLESPKLVVADDFANHTESPSVTYINAHIPYLIDRRKCLKRPNYNGNYSEIPGLVNVDEANIQNAVICRFYPKFPVGNHFPHAMQELYFFIDYWLDNMSGSDNNTITPVFLYDENNEYTFKKWRENAFMMGILDILQSEMGVVVMHTEDYYRCARFLPFDDGASNNNTSPELAAELDLCRLVFHPDRTIYGSFMIKQKMGYHFLRALEWNQYVASYEVGFTQSGTYGFFRDS